MKIGIIIRVLVAIGMIYLISINKTDNNTSIQVDRQIRLSELESVISQLLHGEMKDDFFGITSDGVDCIYFVDNNSKINIEFEVMTSDQKPYVEKMSDFASINNFGLVRTTYGNKPHYSDLNEAPVYRLELEADKRKATEIGVEIMIKIFGKNRMTKFDVIP